MQDVVDTVCKQRVLVREVRVERRTTDVGTLEDVVDDDRVKVLFVDQRDERIA